MSAVTVLGAVLKGAWYTVGERLRSRDSQLETALDNDRTATVQTTAATANRMTRSAPTSAGASSTPNPNARR